jgi:hypothetical protein
MLQNLQSAVVTRVVAVFLLIHAGLILGIYALGRAAAPNGWDETSIILLMSLLCLYGGFLLGVYFIVGKLLPWVKRAQKVEHWTERLLKDLPFNHSWQPGIKPKARMTPQRSKTLLELLEKELIVNPFEKTSFLFHAPGL